MVRKKVVAMLLAGGQGSRLSVLTNRMAKPAVPFGGKYRIIDFPLSNCVNSNIDTVGVLTQYEPLELNAYIGTGQAWDLDRNSGGVFVLPPYQSSNSGRWYSGTANAIFQNMAFIDRYDPEYVLILSGDHIYKMDYALMLDYHISKKADLTVAVRTVPMEEAHRFGIMNTDDTGRIIEFEEKPAHPKSTKASMGIYIFNKKLLEEYLIKDEADPESSKDFGKNVIPAMLADGKKLFAYPFEGYWKDVGTLTSLWEANMDLLGTKPAFDLHTKDWRIYSRNNNLPPHFIADTATVQNSLITEGCDIHGTVVNSVLSNGVTVEAGAFVRDSVLMNNVTVKSGAVVEYSIVDSDAVIGEDAVVGKERSEAKGLAVIGEGLTIAAGRVIANGEMIGSASKNN